MNKALLVDLTTEEVCLIMICGYDDIRHRFTGDVKGRTLQRLGDNTFLRMWTECVQHPSTGIVDAYNGSTMELVDVTVEDYAAHRKEKPQEVQVPGKRERKVKTQETK